MVGMIGQGGAPEGHDIGPGCPGNSPDPHRCRQVSRPDGEALPVGPVGDAGDRVLVPFAPLNLGSRGRVPGAMLRMGLGV